MRILISSTHFSGHLLPELSYAEALRRRGHEILVSAPKSVSCTLGQVGIAHAALNFLTCEELAPWLAALDAANAEEALIVGARDGFLRPFARVVLPSLQQTIDAWLPNLIVRDSFEFAASMVSERSGVPRARVSVHSNQRKAGIVRHLIGPFDEFRQTWGLASDSGASLGAEPIFTAFPAFLDGNAEAMGWQVPFRSREPYAPPTPSKTPPAWASPDGEPLIYITFGTVSASSERAKATYRAAREAVSTMPVRALLTTGPVMEAKALGEIPANVSVETNVPQVDIFPFARALVCHGGSGTLLGGLATDADCCGADFCGPAAQRAVCSSCEAMRCGL